MDKRNRQHRHADGRKFIRESTDMAVGCSAGAVTTTRRRRGRPLTTPAAADPLAIGIRSVSRMRKPRKPTDRRLANDGLILRAAPLALKSASRSAVLARS
jgi:hypothetical protein